MPRKVTTNAHPIDCECIQCQHVQFERRVDAQAKVAEQPIVKRLEAVAAKLESEARWACEDSWPGPTDQAQLKASVLRSVAGCIRSAIAEED